MGYGYILPWVNDAFSGTQQGFNNILFNTAYELSRPGNFSQVPTMNDGWIYPDYTSAAPSFQGFLNNYAWQQQNNAFWSSLGIGNGILGNNGLSPVLSNLGTLPGGPTDSNSSLSDEEKVYKKQYDRLKGFLTQLNKYAQKDSSNILTQSQRDKLDSVLKSTSKKTNQEKLAELQGIYNELDKADIKKFIVEAYKTDDSKLFHAKLMEAGYEDPNGIIEQGNNNSGNAITALHTALKSIGKDDANTSVPFGSVQGYDVLDIISSWNSAYPSESFISLYKNSYNKVDHEERDTVKGGYQPLIDNLISVAKSIAGTLDDDSNKALKDAATKLSEAFEKNNFSNMEKYFNEVYVMTRIAKAKSLGNQLADKYGEIDSNLFNDSMFLAETIEDLKNEKLGSECAKYSKSVKMHKSRSHEGSPVVSEDTPDSVTISDLNSLIEEKKKEIQDTKKAMSKADTASMGRDLYDLTNGDTADHKYSIVNETLESVDKSNVVQFLNSYNDKKKYNPDNKASEGIIEMLDDEHDGGAIKMENKIHLIEALLEKAEEDGIDLAGTKEYKEIKAILKMYEDDGKYSDKKTFNQGVKGFKSKKSTWTGIAAGVVGVAVGGPIGAAIGAAIGAITIGIGQFTRRTNNEELDKNMKLLLDKINEKMAKNAEADGIKKEDAINKTEEYIQLQKELNEKNNDLKIYQMAKKDIDKLDTVEKIESFRTKNAETISKYPDIGIYLDNKKEKLIKKQEAKTTTENNKDTESEAGTENTEETTTK